MCECAVWADVDECFFLHESSEFEEEFEVVGDEEDECVFFDVAEDGDGGDAGAYSVGECISREYACWVGVVDEEC